jgi:hypothetical protein
MADARVHLTFRVRTGARDWLDSLRTGLSTAEKKVTRTDIVRAMFVVAKKHEAELKRIIKEDQ